MSKINPNLQVEEFARDVRNNVVQVLLRKIHTALPVVFVSHWGFAY